MIKLKDYFNKEYTTKSIYVSLTVLATFILGMILYYLAGHVGSIWGFISGVLKPLVLGMVLTYLIEPVVTRIEAKLAGKVKKESAGRILAVILSFLIIILVLGIIIGVVAFTVSRSLSSFNPTEVKDYAVYLSEQFSKFWTTIEDQLEKMNINVGSVGDMLGKIFAGVKSGATTFFFAVIFSIYFLLDRNIRAYWKKVIEVLIDEKTRDGLKQFAADADRVFSGYIRGQAMDASIVGVLASVSMLIAGVPYAVVIGILTGIGNLVPYVGPVVGFGSLAIVCLAEGSLKHLIIGAVILGLVMFIDGNVINPRMLSSNVEVHPVLVIVALLAGGGVGGVVGMLVAVPVAALLKLQFEKFIDKRKTIAEKEETA